MAKRKNVLFIFSDQHNKHMLGCYGNNVIKTPNLDNIAKNGVMFTDAYTPCPLCAPARAALAIGDYGSKHGYFDNVLAYNGEIPSWGTRLEQSNVHVTTFGKLHFKSDNPETGFTDQRIPLHLKDGKGDVYGLMRDREITRPPFGQALEEAKTGMSDYIRLDMEVASRTAKYLLEEAGKDEKPFVLYAGFVSPHFPLTVPKEYADLYKTEDIPIPVQFRKEQWPHHPVIDGYRRYCCHEDIDDRTKLEAIRIYYGMCSFVDAQVGIILDALKKSGHADDTYVIYSSDHGDTMGEHGVFFKSTLYEGSVGVPLLISGPGIPNGKTESSPVSLIDIYQTVMDCTSSPMNRYDKSLPGRSLLETMKNPDMDREIYSEYMSFGFYTASFMLRKGRYKLVDYVGERPQFFDLETDPDECNDLAGKTEYSKLISDYQSILRNMVDEEELDRESKEAQIKAMDDLGGFEQFMKTYKPYLFSPIPDLTR